MIDISKPQPEHQHNNSAKLFAFFYGSFVYLAFWFTLIYVVGFVGNYFSPLISTSWGMVLPLKSIDMGREEPFLIAFLINLALILLFGLQHSVMPRQFFKRFITRLVPPHLERSTYIVVAIAALALLMWQWRPMTAVIWRVDNPTFALLLDALSVAGWIIVLVATFQVGHWKIFGVEQVLDFIQDKRYSFDTSPCLSAEFFKTGWPVTQGGLWNLSRHPDFFGFVLAFWATPTMTVGHLMFAGSLTIYIVIGTFLLERNLRELYGRDYEIYVAARSKIVPRLPAQKPRIDPAKTEWESS